MCLLACACAQAPHDLPRRFQVDDSFSAEKQSMIVEMTAAWNEVGQEYLGLPAILLFNGPVKTDGFDYATDLTDGNSVVYRITDETEFAKYRNLGRARDRDDDPTGIMASTFDEDIVVFDAWMSTANPEFQDSRFRRFLAHEFGHFLGIPVELNEYEPAACLPDDVNSPVMCVASFNGQFPTAIQPADIRLLCSVQDCQKQP
jgi:hypothetical protein